MSLQIGCIRAESFAIEVKEILECTVEIAKRNEFHTFAVIKRQMGS